jgi:hypothetical protein
VFLKRTVESSYVQYRWPTWVTVNRSFLQLLASFGRVLRGAGTLPQIARVNNLSLGSHALFFLHMRETSSAMLFSSYSSWQLLRVYLLTSECRKQLILRRMRGPINNPEFVLA